MPLAVELVSLGVALGLGAHDGRLEDLFLGLEVRVRAEQCVLVKLEPLLRLDTSSPQVNEIDEHGEEEDDEGDDDDDLEADKIYTVINERMSNKRKRNNNGNYCSTSNHQNQHQK